MIADLWGGAGDRAAFETWVITHQLLERLGAYATRRGVDPDDLAQETLGRMWRDQLHAVREWPDRVIWGYARYVALEFGRARARHDHDEYVELEGLGDGPLDMVIDGERHRLLHTGLGGLQPRDRTVILLWTLGWSTREIAAVISTSPETARKALTRALDRLATRVHGKV